MPALPAARTAHHERVTLITLDVTPPRFRGVLASTSNKVAMFLADGTLVRATCSLELLEADHASFRRATRPSARSSR